MSLECSEDEPDAPRENEVEPVRLPAVDDAVVDTSALPLPLLVSEMAALVVTDDVESDDESADRVVFPVGVKADDDDRVSVAIAELEITTVPEATAESDTELDTEAVEALLSESADDAERDTIKEAETKGDVVDAADNEGFTVSVAAGDELDEDRLLGDEIAERVSADADDEGETLASEVLDPDCLPDKDAVAEATTEGLRAGDNEDCIDGDSMTDALLAPEALAEIEIALDGDGV